jgi:hypothetical protein
MSKCKKKVEVYSISDKLNEIHQGIKQVREVDIPDLKIAVAVLKADTRMSAKIITGVGGLIAVGLSTAIAFFK